MRKKIYINLITVFLLLFQADILFGQTNNKIIITVGKYPITYFDLFKEIKMISILSNNEINENNREQIKKLAVASLIKSKIKIGEIKKLGIKNYSKRELEQLIQNTSRRIGLDRNGLRELLKKNNQLFNEIENKFNVDKEILLSLWGIETIYGKYVGKMDIISSLATLSYDKRRSDFFSSQLFTVLQLIDKKLIDPSKYYGSWAGAYGNFQFMPSTIKKYAIDYDNNEKIELKNSLEDSLASAANYINKNG